MEPNLSSYDHYTIGAVTMTFALLLALVGDYGVVKLFKLDPGYSRFRFVCTLALTIAIVLSLGGKVLGYFR